MSDQQQHSQAIPPAGTQRTYEDFLESLQRNVDPSTPLPGFVPNPPSFGVSTPPNPPYSPAGPSLPASSQPAQFDITKFFNDDPLPYTFPSAEPAQNQAPAQQQQQQQHNYHHHQPPFPAQQPPINSPMRILAS